MTISADTLKKTILTSTAFCAVLVLLLAGCSSDKIEWFEYSGGTMGTSLSIKCRIPNEVSWGYKIKTTTRETLDAVNAKMSTYQSDSELSEFNRHPAGTPFALSPETIEVFQIAQEVSVKSDGAFDCTVGPLVNAWGFGPGKGNGVPDPNSLEAIREHVGYTLIKLGENGTISKAKDGVYCDLSAVAKGYAVDRIALALDALDITDYMIEVGGEVRTKGLNKEGTPWRIGIEQPEAMVGTVHKVVGLSGKAMATSGDYRNFFEENGTRYAHAIDPRTGRPVTHQLASVSVIHESCAWADAWATALLVLGPEKGYEKAVDEGLAAYFIEYTGDSTFKDKATPAFTQKW